jgi:hypothetical protein
MAGDGPKPRGRRPSSERPPDIEIGATARANRLRFHDEPETDVEFRGDSIEETDSGSVRHNLPDEVEPGVTYRNVAIGWRAAGWVEDIVKDEQVKKTLEEEEEEEKKGR